MATTALGGIDANADMLKQTSEVCSLVTAWSATGWFKRTSNAADGVVLSMRSNSDGAYNRALINSSGMLRVGSNIGSVDVLSLTLNTWYKIAITQSGATRQLTCYVQPASGGSVTAVTTTSVNESAAGSGFYVAGDGSFGLSIRGSITEVRLWIGRTLSQAEVEAEWASQLTPVITTDLVGHYPLIDVATMFDASVGGDLTSVGSGSWTTDTSGPFTASGAELAASTAGSSSASASLTAAITLAGSTVGSSSAAAGLTAGINLAGELAGGSSTSGDLSTGITLAGAVSGSASTVGGLTTGIALVASPAGAGAAAAELTTGITLAGALSGTSSTSAALTAAGAAAELEGSASGTASASADLSTGIALAGASTGTSSTASSLTTAINLAASVSVSSSASLSNAPPITTIHALEVDGERRVLFVPGEVSTLTPDPERRTLYAHH